MCCFQRRNLNEVELSVTATVQSKIPKAKQGVHLLRKMDLQKVIEYATSRLELFLNYFYPKYILYSFVKFRFLKHVNLQACLIICDACCIFSPVSKFVFQMKGKFFLKEKSSSQFRVEYSC